MAVVANAMDKELESVVTRCNIILRLAVFGSDIVRASDLLEGGRGSEGDIDCILRSDGDGDLDISAKWRASLHDRTCKRCTNKGSNNKGSNLHGGQHLDRL